MCFENLAAIADPVFSQYKHRSVAYEVISLLGWMSLNDFRQDMMFFDI